MGRIRKGATHWLVRIAVVAIAVDNIRGGTRRTIRHTAAATAGSPRECTTIDWVRRPCDSRRPIVGVAATPSGHGYWRVARRRWRSHRGRRALLRIGGRPDAADAVVGIAATPSGHGYWLVDRRGDVYSFGNAPFRGSMGGHHLNKPIVGIASTPSGQGYWLVASDGGIFALSRRLLRFDGCDPLNKPIVGMAVGTQWHGLLARGERRRRVRVPRAGFHGSMGGRAAERTGGRHVGGAEQQGLHARCIRRRTVPLRLTPLLRLGRERVYRSLAGSASRCRRRRSVTGSRSPNAQTYAFSPSTKPPKCATERDRQARRMASDLFNRLNQERAARGLGALAVGPVAGELRGHRGAPTWRGNGFRHSDIGTLLGPYNYVGENIAAGQQGGDRRRPAQRVDALDGHRANILAPGFTRVGVGAYLRGRGSIWLTEDFGRPSRPGSPPGGGGTPVNPVVRSDSGNGSAANSASRPRRQRLLLVMFERGTAGQRTG